MSLKNIVVNDIIYSDISPKLRQLYINGIRFCDVKCNNKFLRSSLRSLYSSNLLRRNYILKDFQREEIEKIRTDYIAFPIPPKGKEVQFKILNKIYPTNRLLSDRFKIETGNCVFCETEEEDLDHLFFLCNFIQIFWLDFHTWLYSSGIQITPFTLNMIMFGVFLKEKKANYGVNVLLILCKYFIHKCRFFKIKPTLAHWKNDLNLLVKSLTLVKKKKAAFFVSFMEDFDLVS